MSEVKIIYSEPVDYFPKETREEFFPEMEVDSEKYNEIARTILRNMINKSDEDNIVFSPYSIYALLTLLSDSTTGETRNEILDFLKDDELDGRDTFSVADRNLRQSKGFISANAVIVKNEYKDEIRQEYLNTVKNKFNADFLSSNDIVRDVNKWVKDKTNGMVPEIADESMNEMIVGLINVVSFIAKWKENYDLYSIYDEFFTSVDNAKSEVTMMHSSEDYYMEDESFTGFIKDYKNDEFSFVGLLPKKTGKKSMKESIESLDVSSLYRNVFKAEVEVTLPAFKIRYGDDLSEIFKTNGIKSAFENIANCSPMSSTVPLKIEKIVHEAYIEVDRNGTKAAAATCGLCAAAGVPDFDRIKIVNLNRPFVYAIVHNKTQLPVFLGIVNKL